MTADIVALAVTAVVCIILPLIILGIVWKKNPMERKGISITFCLGLMIYLVMQWGVKEHGLQYLFSHGGLSEFVEKHYIPYILLVAIAGAVLALIPVIGIVVFLFKNQMSFAKSSMMALGYGMAESVDLVGYRCIYTIITFFKDDDVTMNTSTGELFLSGYERFLIMVIYIAIMVAFVYFLEQKMLIRGFLTTVFCFTCIHFFPGFFLAFTTKEYIEVFERPVALAFSYIVLTMGAVCGAAVLNALKYSLKDERIDSKQAVAAYEKQQAEKKLKRMKKKTKNNLE